MEELQIRECNIQSDRLLLKEITWKDMPDIHRLYSCPEVDEYNTLGIPKDIEVTRELVCPMIEAQNKVPRNSYNWKIVKKNSGEMIGMAGFNLLGNRFKLGEIYYELFPSEWGNGSPYVNDLQITEIKINSGNFQQISELQ